jgi:hypothetical protein
LRPLHLDDLVLGHIVNASLGQELHGVGAIQDLEQDWDRRPLVLEAVHAEVLSDRIDLNVQVDSNVGTIDRVRTTRGRGRCQRL